MALMAVLWSPKQLPFPEHPVHRGDVSEPNITDFCGLKAAAELQNSPLKSPSTLLLCGADDDLMRPDFNGHLLMHAA